MSHAFYVLGAIAFLFRRDIAGFSFPTVVLLGCYTLMRAAPKSKSCMVPSLDRKVYLPCAAWDEIKADRTIPGDLPD